jgi:hypothetical protein
MRRSPVSGSRPQDHGQIMLDDLRFGKVERIGRELLTQEIKTLIVMVIKKT